MNERIAIGSDHAGFKGKEIIKEVLDRRGIAYKDFGTFSMDSCDYPEYARKVAEAVSAGEFGRGIICCGSGIGVSMTANKVRGIRAALCHNEETATLCRQHNDANVLCFGERTIDQALVPGIIEAFLDTAFEGGRHQRRVDKIEAPREGESSGVWRERVTSRSGRSI